MLVAWGDGGQDVLDTEASGPRLYREPNQRQDDTLDEGKVLAVDAPDKAADYRKAEAEEVCKHTP